MTFDQLPIGAHYRLRSAFNGSLLPSVRVKVTATQYTMLGRSFKKLAALAVRVVPVSDNERQTGVRDHIEVTE